MFLTPTQTGIHTLRNTWSSQLVEITAITTFFQAVKSSGIENETVHGLETEDEAMEFENGEHCLMLLFHKQVHICTFVVLVELSDVDAKVLVEAPVSSGVIQGKYCIKLRLIFGLGT